MPRIRDRPSPGAAPCWRPCARARSSLCALPRLLLLPRSRNEADVRRDRLPRFRPIQSVRDAPDLRSELRELLFDGLVAAIDVVDALDLGTPFGDQAREHQARRGAQ